MVYSIYNSLSISAGKSVIFIITVTGHFVQINREL